MVLNSNYPPVPATLPKPEEVTNTAIVYLTDWRIKRRNSGPCLNGVIWHHPRFRNGQRIDTSVVEKIEFPDRHNNGRASCKSRVYVLVGDCMGLSYD